MWSHVKSPKLSMKIAMMGAGGAIVTAVALVALAVWQSGQYNKLAQNEVNQLIDADFDHIARGVYNLIRTANETVQQQVDADLRVARHVLENAGGVNQSRGTVEWTCINQLTGDSVKTHLPKMLVGGRWLGQNADTSVETRIVDETTRLVGETATIFQIMSKRGDMVRVATTVTDQKGNRAIGTYIPAVNPDGTPNPVIRAVLNGETFQGLAFVVDAWYLTAYEAIKDGEGNLVGMLYVGVRQDSVAAKVRQAILATTVGTTGYVYVLGGKGHHRGHYIISQAGERDGEDIWDITDSDNRFVIREIISKAVALRGGELATEQYRWQNPGESIPRWKIARLAYYEPWDWVIGTSVYLDELETYKTVLSSGRMRMTTTMLIAGLIITLSVGALGALLAWSIIRPIRQMTAAVETIVEGNLDQTVGIQSRDEIGGLARAFNVMTERLKLTIEGLHHSEEKFRDIHDNALEGIFQTTFEGKFLNVNPSMARILGYDSPEDLTRSIVDVREQVYFRPEDREIFVTTLRQKGVILEHEVEARLKNGGTIWISISAHIVRDEAGKPLHIEGFVTDSSDRKRAEESLRRLNRELEAISQCNQTVLRATSEQTLLKDICSIVCDKAGYRMAWVGYAGDNDAKTVCPVAWAGVEEGYLASADFTWADTERGRGPSGAAIRTGRTASISDFATDPIAVPWREDALRRGYRSSIGMPLKDDNSNTFGALVIHSEEPNAFTQDEIRLMEELAGNLAFGITTLRARAERKQAEEQLLASLKEKELLLKEIHHRVKNNMQVITSLLNLQSMSLTDENMKGVFMDSQNRIRSMALIHELLYYSGIFGSVDFLEYCNTLIHRLHAIYQRPDILLTIQGDKLTLNLDQAIPCGLILNELVSNALKHAFPPGVCGRISIQIKKQGHSCCLTVSDDGVGLHTGMDVKHSSSVGMQLLTSLTQQIEGTLSIASGPGVTSTLTFPLTRA